MESPIFDAAICPCKLDHDVTLIVHRNTDGAVAYVHSPLGTDTEPLSCAICATPGTRVYLDSS